MYTGLIARRYATALADFAAANGEERRVYDEVRHLAAVYRTDLSLRDALLSPVLPAAAKSALFRQVLDGTVSRTLEGFVSLVLRCASCCTPTSSCTSSGTAYSTRR